MAYEKFYLTGFWRGAQYYLLGCRSFVSKFTNYDGELTFFAVPVPKQRRCSLDTAVIPEDLISKSRITDKNTLYVCSFPSYDRALEVLTDSARLASFDAEEVAAKYAADLSSYHARGFALKTDCPPAPISAVQETVREAVLFVFREAAGSLVLSSEVNV